MSWTKRQLIIQGFDSIGMGSYAFDLGSEELENALKKLDAMMAAWNAQGIRLGYPIPGSPENASLSTETELQDAAGEAVYLNLGLRLAMSYGKQLSFEHKMMARSALDNLISKLARPITRRQVGGLPLGAGQKNREGYGLFSDATTEEPGIQNDSLLDSL